jgi:chemotaxis protein MotB
MKQLTRMIVTLVALGVVMNLGGCMVPKSELDAATTLNQQLVKEKTDLRAERDEAQLDVQRLQKELDIARSNSDSAERVARLEAELMTANAEYSNLQMMYDDLANTRGSQLPVAVDTALEELALEHPDMIEYVPSVGMVKFKSDLTFPKGSDELNAGASEALKDVAAILASTDADSYNIYVAGHTDDVPVTNPNTMRRHPNNWYLSVHRAVVVQEALESAGVDADRLAIIGFGEYQPAEPNGANHTGNAANRRVELWIVAPGQFLSID